MVAMTMGVGSKIPAVDRVRSVPEKAQLLLVGFCPAFRLGDERGEADGKWFPHRLAPFGGCGWEPSSILAWGS